MKKIIKLENGNIKVQTLNTDPSKTQQQFKEQSDINKIMKKYHATGMINHLNGRPGRYGDFSNAKTYQDSLQTVINAQNSFQNLPSDVRKRFSNDPYEMLSFVNDPQNKQEAINLGLIPKPAPKNDDLNDDKGANNPT